MYAEQAHRGYKVILISSDTLQLGCKLSETFPTFSVQEAVIALNSLQSNANVLAAIQAAGPQLPAQVFAHTTYYLHRLGYKV